MEAVYATNDEPWVPENTFGARLALIRQHFGWNVVEAAKACDLDDGSWHNWERGKGTRKFEEVTRQIALATNCDLGWLRGMGPGTPMLLVTERESDELEPTQLALDLPEYRHLSPVN